jgi:hypothetical protein
VAEDWHLPLPTFASEESGSGVRFGVDTAAFARWWRAIPAEDQAEFTGIHGGDELLARFVFAFDYLTTMKRETSSGSVIVLAYMQAAKMYDDELAVAQVRAQKAWRHDSVVQLLDKLRYRSKRQASERIVNQAAYLIENLVAEALNPDFMHPVKDKVAIVQLALQFNKLVQTEDIADRSERNKRGAQLAAKALEAAKANDNEEITPDGGALYLRMLHDKLGPEWLQKTLGKLEPAKDPK